MQSRADVTPLKIYIITGISGSGKSTAVDVMEDAGYFCVDNMPVALLPKFLEMPFERHSKKPGVAFVMDAREEGFIAQHPSVFKALHDAGHRLEILFLEARDQTLLQRYSQTRRHHPLGRGANLLEIIQQERQALQNLRDTADRVIDTSEYTVHQLKAVIRQLIQSDVLLKMQIHVMSFGFKYGSPANADLLIDVRFLANPYFLPELKALNGEASRVRDFVLGDANSQVFLAKYLDLLDFLVPLYEKEGKAYLTLAIGCTGGHHRSVTIARSIFDHLLRQGWDIEITHRDIGRQPATPAPDQPPPA
jgi:UPF0042 nucleotide-binding protein